MQVTFKWQQGNDGDQQLMMLSKAIKNGRVAIAESYQVATGKYEAEFIDELLAGKDGGGFAHAETAMRHVEKLLGIYKAPKKKAKK